MSVFEQVVKEMQALYKDLVLDPSGKSATHQITTTEDLVLYEEREPNDWDVINKDFKESTPAEDVTGPTKLIVKEFIHKFKTIKTKIESQPKDPIENLKEGGFEISAEPAEHSAEEKNRLEREENERKLAALEAGEIQKPESKTVQRAPRKQEPTRTEYSPVKAVSIPTRMRETQINELTTQDIIDYLCPDANVQEAMIFLKLCQARGINPFLREAYLIKFKPTEPASMVVARDYFARKAEEHPQYAGFEAGIIIQNAEGEFEKREGTFLLPKEMLVGGWCKVYRKDRDKPFVSEVALHEYIQKTREGNPNKFWAGKPATMIRKVAFSQCHREAFPGDFSGMYDSTEIEGGMEGLEDAIIEANYQEVEA